MSGRFQRVLLNGQTSDWETIQAWVPQGWILGPLFFLIEINDPTNNLKSNVKLFADDTIFIFIDLWSFRDCKCTKQWLKKNSQMGHTMENTFHPDPTKQTQEVIFSRNHKLDKRLDFRECLKDKFSKQYEHL